MEEQSPKFEKSNNRKEEILRDKNYMRMKEEILRDKKYLKMNECRDGYLYIILARHTSVGICGDEGKSFTYNRKKFEDRYLWPEEHYDTGAPFGTVMPLKEIEKAPEFANDEEKLAYLARKAEELKPELEPEMERLTQDTD